MIAHAMVQKPNCFIINSLIERVVLDLDHKVEVNIALRLLKVGYRLNPKNTLEFRLVLMFIHYLVPGFNVNSDRFMCLKSVPTVILIEMLVLEIGPRFVVRMAVHLFDPKYNPMKDHISFVIEAQQSPFVPDIAVRSKKPEFLLKFILNWMLVMFIQFPFHKMEISFGQKKTFTTGYLIDFHILVKALLIVHRVNTPVGVKLTLKTAMDFVVFHNSGSKD
jgi:hypothetical protein